MKKFNVVVVDGYDEEVVGQFVVEGVDILAAVKKFRELDKEFCYNDKDLAEWHSEDEITDDVLLGLIEEGDGVYYALLAEEFMFDFVEI